MNKQGQLMIFGVMMFVMAFIVAVLLSGTVKEFTDDARIDLSCELTNQTTGTYILCSAIDLVLPFFILTIILAGFGILARATGGG